MCCVSDGEVAQFGRAKKAKCQSVEFLGVLKMKLEFETDCGFPQSISVRYERYEALPERLQEIIKELHQMVLKPLHSEEQNLKDINIPFFNVEEE